MRGATVDADALNRNVCVDHVVLGTSSTLTPTRLTLTRHPGDGLDLEQELGLHQAVDDEQRVGRVFAAGEQLGEQRARAPMNQVGM